MRKIFLAVIFILPMLACSVFTPKPSNTATSQPMASSTRKPSPSLAATVTTVATTIQNTRTATITPGPFAPITPTLSPTPHGLVSSPTIGFSVILPVGWSVSDTTADNLIASSKVDQLVFSGASAPTDASFTFDAAIDLMQSSDMGLLNSSTVTSQSKISLADGTEADEAILEGKSAVGGPKTVIVVLARSTTRDYLFFIYGPSSAIEKKASVITDIFGSIQLLGVQLYGLDRSQTLVILGGDPSADSLDPARTRDGAGGWSGLLYSGLVSLSPQLQIEPDLAESWTVSDDGLVYTFTLRPGISFQSGKPITADDFRYSWERAANPDTGSTTAPTYLGDIAGFLDKADGKANTIAGVKVINDRTLQVTIDAPKPYFLAKLSYPSSFVVDEASLSASPDDWEFKSNASGPYSIKEYKPGELLVLERNSAYHTPAGIPFVAALMYQTGTTLGLYQDGEIDIASLYPSDALLVQSSDNPLHQDLFTSTSMCTSLIQMNNTIPPMDDPNVRKAFTLAVDTQRLTEVSTQGTSTAATGILPPAMPGHTDGFPTSTYDPAAAKKALADSKYATHLPEITLTTSGYANQQDDFINALVNMWQTNLGVTIQVDYLDPEAYTTEAVSQHGQLVSYGWCADYPDPENFLDILYHTGGDFNVSEYSNPEIDTLLETARVELDVASRLKIYQQIEGMLLQDYAAIPLMNDTSYTLVKPTIQGYIEPVMDVRYLNLLNFALNP